MYRVILVFVFQFACLFSFSQAKSDLKNQQLKGKVKSVTVSQLHRYKKNGVFTPWEKSYRQASNFNTSGNLAEYNEYLANDSQSYRVTYTYSLKEKKADVQYFDKFLKPTSKRTWKYDEKGNKVEEIQYTIDGRQDRRYTYSYDDRGNMIESVSYKKDGSLSSRSTWKYDNKNNKLEYLLETPGYASSTWKYVYDDKGNNTEESWLNGKGGVIFRFVRTYDTNGNVTKELKYKDGDKLHDTINKTYTYDKQGNWIKRVESTSTGEDYHVDERVIVYY